MIRKYGVDDIPKVIELFRLHHPFSEDEGGELEGELEDGINIKVK